ncbi:MAG: hypothetical protein EXQ57_06415 [Bryobacterales bacterium]|nr:hypothetical protein [Bryobacterales bacterium]
MPPKTRRGEAVVFLLAGVAGGVLERMGAGAKSGDGAAGFFVVEDGLEFGLGVLASAEEEHHQISVLQSVESLLGLEMVVLLEDLRQSRHGVLAAVFVVTCEEGDFWSEVLREWRGK